MLIRVLIMLSMALAAITLAGIAYAGDCGSSVITEYKTVGAVVTEVKDSVVTMRSVPLTDYYDHICRCAENVNECHYAIRVRHDEDPPWDRWLADPGCKWVMFQCQRDLSVPQCTYDPNL